MFVFRATSSGSAGCHGFAIVQQGTAPNSLDEPFSGLSNNVLDPYFIRHLAQPHQV